MNSRDGVLSNKMSELNINQSRKDHFQKLKKMFMKRNKARHFLLFNQCMAFVLELLCYIIHILSLIIGIRYVSKSLFSVFNHVWTVPMNTEILKVFESLKFSVF